MRRYVGPLCLLLLLAVPAVSSAEVATIQADLVELDLNLAAAAADGNAVLTYGAVSLHADAITANRASGDVVAVGNLSLRQAGRSLCGDHLQYNFYTDEGVLTNAQVVEQGVIVRGEAIEFSPRRISARDAVFTTCDKPQPDYSLNAGELTLTAEQPDARGRPVSGRLTMDRARVYYHGKRLFSLPKYTVRVGELQQREALPLPMVGYNSRDGYYARLGYSLGSPEREGTAALDLRLTTGRGVRGGIGLSRPRRGYEYFADYVRLDDPRETELQPDRITFSTADVLVDRRPEVGARTRDYPLGRSWLLGGEVSYGRYTEFDEDSEEELAQANRLAITAMARTEERRISPRVTVSNGLGVRVAQYSGGDSFLIGFLRQTLTYRRNEEDRTSLSFIYRPTAGETPFEFDDVEVGAELLAEARRRLNPSYRIRLAAAFGIGGEGGLREAQVALTRTIHCLDYTLGWNQVNHSVILGISLTPPTQQPCPLP